MGKYEHSTDGFIKGPGDTKEGKKNPIYELAHIRDSLLNESMHPQFSTQPDNVLYWSDGGRLEHNSELLNKMEQIAGDNNITEIVHPATGETIRLSEFFETIRASIDYSRKINTQAGERKNVDQSPVGDNTRAEMLKKLFKKKPSDKE